MSQRRRPPHSSATSAAGARKRTRPKGGASTRQVAAQATTRRRLVVASAIGALVVAAGVIYLVQDGGGPATVAAGSGKGLPPVEFETGVVHVHGLGVDPADGVLYAATHSGLFRLPTSGAAVRVANRAQDTMGFSIVGPRTFIGSGHPDFREDDVRPPLLGLLESTDAGESWKRLSLHGKADFHALHAAHGQVYGYDSTSQTFMVSKDRTRWDLRAKLPMRDFAVSPSRPDTVLATTEHGLARSTDGGRSFEQIGGPPGLAVLAWVESGSLYGVSFDGTVHHSADGGLTWRGRGVVGGQPEAIALDVRSGIDTLYVAVAERGILASADGGKTFTTRYKE